MSFLRKLFGPSKNEIWQQLSGEIQGQFHEGGWSRSSKVQMRTKDWIITLDTYTVSTGKTNVTYTRIRAPYANPEGFRFTISGAGLFSRLGKRWFGMQDIKVSHARFDEAFIIKSNSTAKVRELFGSQRIRELIQKQKSIHLTVARDEGWFGAGFPDGIDELRFHVVGVIKDVHRLKDLFELFTEVLNRLCYLAGADENDTDLLIAALLAPGGKVEKDHVVLWEGDPPRHWAAAALSNTKDPEAVEALASVLDDKDPVLVLKAARALRKIGNPKAVPALIPLLGERNSMEQGSLAEDARDALVDLGAEELVGAFEHALKGNPDPLKERMGKHRSAFVEALISALYSPELTDFVHAAEALGVLGAVEALPNLRERSHDHRSWELGREACRNVIADLEARASLPRPAGAEEPGPDTLPRSATEPGTRTDTLPQALDDTTDWKA